MGGVSESCAAGSAVKRFGRLSENDVRACAMSAGCSTWTEVVAAEGCWWFVQQAGVFWLRGAWAGQSSQEA